MEKKYKIKLRYTKPFDQLSTEEQFDLMEGVDRQWDEKRKEWRNDHMIYLIFPILCPIYYIALPFLNLSEFISIFPYIFFLPVTIGIISGIIYGYKFIKRGF